MLLVLTHPPTLVNLLLNLWDKDVGLTNPIIDLQELDVGKDQCEGKELSLMK
jgi:hypothetical protein